MKLFNRISTTLLSSMDGLVTKIENHEAVVDSMISDIQQKAAKAKIQLKRVHLDRASCEEQITKLTVDSQLWQSRALKAVNEEKDETKALECLQRRKQCTGQLDKLTETMLEHRSQEKQLLSNQKKIEERLQEVKHQRNLMRTRESVSGAAQTLKSVEGENAGQLNDAFERWEVSLATMDIDSGSISLCQQQVSDSFEEEYLIGEEQELLRSELELLKSLGNKESEKHDNA